MFSLSQAAGNTTLASLNTTFYSPTSTTTSGLWSLDANLTVTQIDADDDFRSNMPFQPSNNQSGFSLGYSSMASTGLGIFYSSAGKTGNQQEENSSLKFGSGRDSTYRQRNIMRTGSTYDADFAIDIPEEPTPDPFTLSSLLVTTEFLQGDLDLMSDEPVIEARQESIPLSTPQEPSGFASAGEQGRWVLQQILEVSGHTLDSLSAELKTRLEDNGCSTSSPLYVPELPPQSNAVHSQDTFLRRLRDSPILGVNPAAIMSVHSQQEQAHPAAPHGTLILGLVDGEDSEVENPFPFLAIDSACSNDTDLFRLPIPLTTKALKYFEQNVLPYKRESDYEPSISPRSEISTESAFVPTLSRRKARMGPVRTPRGQTTPRVLASPYIVPSESNVGGLGIRTSPIDYGTPVLDAHRGIELSELKAKAERYRDRNQGLEYDKKWLLSFAGKLTPQGLMTEEYRCYIVGCNQSNRRRDHILIHVGGHLDQRPFACTHCPARFLRKNECKRHELSHSGARPFTCDICPFGTTAFVRQDLLKRHQKRTHNLDNTLSRTTKRHRQY